MKHKQYEEVYLKEYGYCVIKNVYDDHYIGLLREPFLKQIEFTDNDIKEGAKTKKYITYYWDRYHGEESGIEYTIRDVELNTSLDILDLAKKISDEHQYDEVTIINWKEIK